MSDEHPVSRRTTLKNLGFAGAAIVLGAGAHAQVPDSKPAQKGEPGGKVVEVAVERMAKGHS